MQKRNKRNKVTALIISASARNPTYASHTTHSHTPPAFVCPFFIHKNAHEFDFCRARSLRHRRARRAAQHVRGRNNISVRVCTRYNPAVPPLCLSGARATSPSTTRMNPASIETLPHPTPLTPLCSFLILVDDVRAGGGGGPHVRIASLVFPDAPRRSLPFPSIRFHPFLGSVPHP